MKQLFTNVITVLIESMQDMTRSVRKIVSQREGRKVLKAINRKAFDSWRKK